MARYLYRLIQSKFLSQTLQNGCKPTREYISGVFMFSMNDLKYWASKKYTCHSNLLEALISQVSPNGEPLSLIRINKNYLLKSKLRIREQGVVLCDERAMKNFEQKIKITDNEIFEIQKQRPDMTEKDIVGFLKSKKNFSYMEFGEPVENAKIHTNKGNAIEYIYTDSIPPEAISLVGKSRKKGNAKTIFANLTSTAKESKQLKKLSSVFVNT